MPLCFLPLGQPHQAMLVLDSPALPLGLAIERVGFDRFEEIRQLNEAVFGEKRVIHRLDRTDLTLLVARREDMLVGYKVGYGESRTTFYSAKGGVLTEFRRLGIARELLYRMEDQARAMGYTRFAYDTFPNKHPGMTVLGLAEAFEVTAAGYNSAYRDYRIRFEREL